jgi:hypothetical protein
MEFRNSERMKWLRKDQSRKISAKDSACRMGEILSIAFLSE